MGYPEKGHGDGLVLGDYNAACFECGRKFKASEMQKYWQGYWLCPEHWNPRQPQDFVRGIPDNMSVPWSQFQVLGYPLIVENVGIVVAETVPLVTIEIDTASATGAELPVIVNVYDVATLTSLVIVDAVGGTISPSVLINLSGIIDTITNVSLVPVTINDFGGKLLNP